MSPEKTSNEGGFLRAPFGGSLKGSFIRAASWGCFRGLGGASGSLVVKSFAH